MTILYGYMNLLNQKILVEVSPKEVGEIPYTWHTWAVRMRNCGEEGDCFDVQLLSHFMAKFGSQEEIVRLLDAGKELY